ncbi:MAG: family 16 glycosylhydrolase [bacterium]|nr:family 16 glycosylhydrolase [bacterium]
MTRHRVSQIVGRLSFVAAIGAFGTSNSVLGQLANGGFEDGGGSLTGWTTFNNSIPNVMATTVTPHSGTHAATVFGGFNGDPNWSGLLQNQPALPGQVWTAQCFARHNTGDALTGKSHLLMKIEYYRVAGGTYGTADMLQENILQVLDRGTPTDLWIPLSLPVPAPTDTVEARLAFVFTHEDNESGSVLIDDVSFTFSADPPDVPAGSAWRLLWHDEFDGPTIDPVKWRVEDAHLIKNNELQYYTPEDVYLDGGCLVLRSQQRAFWGWDGWGNWSQFDYTSGLAESKGRFHETYGRVEVRGKLPSTQGIWPAHWMMVAQGIWPPEIDIMELLGHEPNAVYMTHHWGSWPNVQSHGGRFVGPDFSVGFHTFAIEWQPGRIDWSVDGVVRFTSTTSMPEEPFFGILNTAVGGDWPGNPDASTVFPQHHEIEYVRWYERGLPGDSDGNGDVALDDFAALTDCLDGPGTTPTPSPPRHEVECLTTFDFDEDGDVDLTDAGMMQTVFGSGAR